MRPDMHKVIVERPRVGGHAAGKGRRPRDLDDLPAKQGMRRPYGWYGKDLSDHLGPLRRFLRKQVGRPWDKVYSEICRGRQAGHPLHAHLLRHVFDFVTIENLNLPRAKASLSSLLRRCAERHPSCDKIAHAGPSVIEDRELDESVAEARKITVTSEQRRSFANGNARVDNKRIAREIIADADRRL